MAGSRWLPWDVGYYNNPKARAAGKNGRALHHASSCWSADNMTDGIIRPTDVALLCALAEVPKSTVAIVVREELWEVLADGEGWYIHDFLVHNKSRESIETIRGKWAKKKAGQRGVSPGDNVGDSTQDTDGDSREIPATRQTDRHRSTYISDNDDSVDTGHPSSSSVESIIATTAKAIALKNRDNPPPGFIIGIAKNIRKEQLTTVNACVAEGLTLYDSALRLGADPWYARKALNGSAP